MMRLFWIPLLMACTDDKAAPCADGFGRNSAGQCVAVDMEPPDDEPVDSGSPTINSAPTAPGLKIQPLYPREGAADLHCLISLESMDVDGDVVNYQFGWSSSDGDIVDGNTVPAHQLIEGQQWTCQVIPDDGTDAGPEAEVSTDIGVPVISWNEKNRSLSESDYLFTGEGGNDAAGGYVARGGDVDGDGRGDFLIGAYWNDEGGRNAGKAYLVLGKSLGATRHIPLSEADWHFVGEEGIRTDDTEPPCVEGDHGANDDPEKCGGDWAAHSVNSAGDIDGDGLDDLLVCGYRSDDPYYDAGKVYVVYAASLGSDGGTLDLAHSDVHILGEAELDRMGHSVTSAGDVDGDGRADIMMGAYGNDDGGIHAGKGYVILADSLDGAERFGVGAADYTFIGEAAGDEASYITAPGGDMDGDGLGDFVMASLRNKQGGEGFAPSGENGAGKVYVVMAAELPPRGAVIDLADIERSWLGEEGGDGVGYGTHGLGDVDGDGLGDFMSGAFGSDDGGTNSGKSYVVTSSSMVTPGTRDFADADYSFVGEGEELWSGFGASPAGDVDADGVPDILVGAFRYGEPSTGLTETGKTYLVRLGQLEGPGTYSLADAHASWVGEESQDVAGYKVAPAGDVNADGLDDILIAGWQGDLEHGAGKAWLLLNP
jgi:hypothetical protein